MLLADSWSDVCASSNPPSLALCLSDMGVSGVLPRRDVGDWQRDEPALDVRWCFALPHVACRLGSCDQAGSMTPSLPGMWIRQNTAFGVSGRTLVTLLPLSQARRFSNCKFLPICKAFL